MPYNIILFFIQFIFVSLIVHYLLHSPLVLSFYLDVVFTLSILLLYKSIYNAINKVMYAPPWFTVYAITNGILQGVILVFIWFAKHQNNTRASPYTASHVGTCIALIFYDLKNAYLTINRWSIVTHRLVPHSLCLHSGDYESIDCLGSNEGITWSDN